MPDDTGQTVIDGQTTTTITAPDTTATTAPPAKYADFIDDEGKLKEGWRSKFLPEDLRGEKIYDVIKDIPNAFKTLGHQAKLVGRKGVLLPSEASGQSEWDAFYEAIGRPKTEADYKIEVEPELKDFVDEELIGTAKKLFYGIGLNQKQVDKIWEFERNRIIAQNKALDDYEAQEKVDAENALRQKWGAAYDENLHLVNRMVSENAEPGEEMDYLLAEYGNNPRFALFLGKVAKKFIEHRIITDIETPSAATDEKIKELMNSKPYTDRNHPEHKSVVQQVQNLFAEQARRRQAAKG
jgi:hypothetical protein